MEPHRVANLNLKFPALTTPSSFQAFARSPRPKSRRVLDLKVPNVYVFVTTTIST